MHSDLFGDRQHLSCTQDPALLRSSRRVSQRTGTRAVGGQLQRRPKDGEAATPMRTDALIAKYKYFA